MINEVNEAQAFLKEKFGNLDTVPAGTYAIPTETSLGPAYMKVVIDENKGMSDFHLFWDEELTLSWHTPNPAQEKVFGKKLENLINIFSIENGSNTPDFILAEYLIDCLRAFEKASNAREKWFLPTEKEIKERH